LKKIPASPAPRMGRGPGEPVFHGVAEVPH